MSAPNFEVKEVDGLSEECIKYFKAMFDPNNRYGLRVITNFSFRDECVEILPDDDMQSSFGVKHPLVENNKAVILQNLRVVMDETRTVLRLMLGDNVIVPRIFYDNDVNHRSREGRFAKIPVLAGELSSECVALLRTADKHEEARKKNQMQMGSGARAHNFNAAPIEPIIPSSLMTALMLKAFLTQGVSDSDDEGDKKDGKDKEAGMEVEADKKDGEESEKPLKSCLKKPGQTTENAKDAEHVMIVESTKDADQEVNKISATLPFTLSVSAQALNEQG
jgi:hypothetical protein